MLWVARLQVQTQFINKNMHNDKGAYTIEKCILDTSYSDNDELNGAKMDKVLYFY